MSSRKGNGQLADVIYAFADVMARPVAFVIMTLAAVMAPILGVVFHLGDAYWTAINIGISIITMVIGQAVLVGARRSELANDLKQDRIIEMLPGDNDAIGSEKMHAADLEALKKEVEERTGNA